MLSFQELRSTQFYMTARYWPLKEQHIRLWWSQLGTCRVYLGPWNMQRRWLARFRTDLSALQHPFCPPPALKLFSHGRLEAIATKKYHQREHWNLSRTFANLTHKHRNFSLHPILIDLNLHLRKDECFKALCDAPLALNPPGNAVRSEFITKFWRVLMLWELFNLNIDKTGNTFLLSMVE